MKPKSFETVSFDLSQRFKSKSDEQAKELEVRCSIQLSYGRFVGLQWVTATYFFRAQPERTTREMKRLE